MPTGDSIGGSKSDYLISHKNTPEEKVYSANKFQNLKSDSTF